MQSLVLTTAFGYESWKADLFFRSIPDSFDGEVVVFSDRDITPSSAAAQYKVMTPETHPHLFQSPLQLNSSNNSRYLVYKRYLAQPGVAPENILLCDLRDVVFQANPFDNFHDDLLHVASEPISLGECGANSSWFRDIYGSDMLSQCKNHPVICSGTTFGKPESISNYLDWMENEILEHGPRHDLGNSVMIMDQALHIMYCSRHPDQIFIESSESGSIATLAHHKTFLINEKGQLLNQKGQPYKIVHQYDRIRPLRGLIKETYGFKDHFDLENALRHFLSTSISAKWRKSIKAVMNVVGGQAS